MTYELSILGCGSATPSVRHNPSAQVLNFRGNLHLIDCGEGARKMMAMLGLPHTRLGRIYISHCHGDHCFGLPGVLSSMVLGQRGGEVHVHLDRMTYEQMHTVIERSMGDAGPVVTFDVMEPGRHKIYEDKALTVESFPLYHRVPCSGFIFREKRGERLYNAEAGARWGVPTSQIAGIKRGADYVTADGRTVPNGELTLPPRPAVSYAYCSDTRADERVARSIEGVDVVYHEATYTDADRAKAVARGHSTGREAGRIARLAGARHLILGHYSNSLRDPGALLDEAREEFGDNVSLAGEGLTFDLRALASKS